MASGPIERMVYVLGIATAVVGWAGDKVISSLTTAPTIFHALTYSDQPNKRIAEIEIVNLSRDKQLKQLDVEINTGRRGQVNCAPSDLQVGGLLWNSNQTQPTHPKGGQNEHSVTLQWLMPGSSFTIYVTLPARCTVDYSLFPQGDTAFRITSDGLERFASTHQLRILFWILVVSGAGFIVFLLIWSLYRPKQELFRETD